MANQRMILMSHSGTVIIATLERLSGRALIVPGSAREHAIGGIDFDYESTTDIF